MSPLLSAIAFLFFLTWTTALPTPVDRAYRVKLDPFIALANTLREEDLQQQQRRPIRHNSLQPELDYETAEMDKLNEKQPIELWQVRQLQHEMGRAAMMMPMFEREQRKWAYEMEEEPSGRREDDYGTPVMSEEEGQLYRDNEEPVYTYYPQQISTGNNYLKEQEEELEEAEREEEEKEEEDEEKRLLMDTLVQYMYLTGKEQVKRSDNRGNGQKEESTGSQQKNFFNSLKMPLVVQQQSEEQHITNSTKEEDENWKVPAEDELIHELDTLKTNKN